MKLYNVADRARRLENWHKWFAWHPEAMADGQVVWLEILERRLEGGKARFDDDGLIRVFEYRKPVRQ